MTRTQNLRAASALWLVAAVVFVAALTRSLRVEWPHLPSATPPRVEDRRVHRFRNFTYGESERLLRALLRQSQTSRLPRERAVALARAAALQRERGFNESAQAAGQKALQLAAGDARLQAEIRAILEQPVRLEDILGAGRQPRP